MKRYLIMDNKIIWQKMNSPFEGELDLQEDIYDDGLEYVDDMPPPKEYAKGVITQFGVMPLNEHYNPFNMWIGHTNFTLSPSVRDIIKSVPGVETLSIMTPYRFTISIGRAFDIKGENSVLKNINMKVLEFLGIILRCSN
jgi:hypothetical protein